MQIDFHHGVTYVVARLAGFTPAQAETVAHSAQYVDDATSSGELWFDNGGLYERISSAHKFYDYRNMEALSNHRVWIPFHFLPGNKGEPRPAAAPLLTREDLVERCITRPDSYPAREMMAAAVQRQKRPFALHRLGIASHVYADTWAHQGFVGLRDRINLATQIRAANDAHHEKTFGERFADFFGHGVEEVEELFIGKALPVGHGVVLSYPDRPYLVWSYRNGRGETVERDNPRAYAEAARQLYQWYRRYRDFPKDGAAVIERAYPVPAEVAAVDRMLAQVVSEMKLDRHAAWLAAIGDGTFGFRDALTYVEIGEGSWKQAALGTLEDVGSNAGKPIACPPGFMESDWKYFHDALQAHRFYVLNEMLPGYGILSM